eukprot:TRINITY_DN49353_c0_g1_i1.p1 TRINITY_DN49353_c0_g1~~TRINITY_DN49353_c0_g1_i1.p1  ORF type:complete len:129 (-),score=4.15 TRINITY_DN49353_c0_g1_i1:204-590(-)
MEGAFLPGCTGLTSIDLSPLSNLERLPEGFLNDCSGLKRIDLSPLSAKLRHIPYAFLSGCTGLESIVPIRAKWGAPKAFSCIGPTFSPTFSHDTDRDAHCEFLVRCHGHPHPKDLETHRFSEAICIIA